MEILLSIKVAPVHPLFYIYGLLRGHWYKPVEPNGKDGFFARAWFMKKDHPYRARLDGQEVVVVKGADGVLDVMAFEESHLDE